MSSHSPHHLQKVLLAQFSQGGLKHHSFYFVVVFVVTLRPIVTSMYPMPLIQIKDALLLRGRYITKTDVWKQNKVFSPCVGPKCVIEVQFLWMQNQSILVWSIKLSYACRVEDNICFSLKSIYMTFFDQKNSLPKSMVGWCHSKVNSKMAAITLGCIMIKNIYFPFSTSIIWSALSYAIIKLIFFTFSALE